MGVATNYLGGALVGGRGAKFEVECQEREGFLVDALSILISGCTILMTKAASETPCRLLKESMAKSRRKSPYKNGG